MRWFFTGLAVLGVATFLFAQEQMNVQQLADFIRSEIALNHHTDKQIAAYVKKLHLTERLTDKTILDLQAQGGEWSIDGRRVTSAALATFSNHRCNTAGRVTRFRPSKACD